MKEMLLIIFGLFVLVGLIVFRLRFIKDRNPNAELLSVKFLLWDEDEITSSFKYQQVGGSTLGRRYES